MAIQMVLGGVDVLRVRVVSNKMSFSLIASLSGIFIQYQFFIQCMFGVNLKNLGGIALSFLMVNLLTVFKH